MLVVVLQRTRVVEALSPCILILSPWQGEGITADSAMAFKVLL